MFYSHCLFDQSNKAPSHTQLVAWTGSREAIYVTFVILALAISDVT